MKKCRKFGKYIEIIPQSILFPNSLKKLLMNENTEYSENIPIYEKYLVSNIDMVNSMNIASETNTTKKYTITKNTFTLKWHFL